MAIRALAFLCLVPVASILACGGGPAEETAGATPVEAVPADAPGTAPESSARTFTVRGRVVMSQYEGAALVIDHEEIPGYMAAMRMTFRPKDPAEIEELRPGDKISFRYVVDGLDQHIDRVEVLPADTELKLAPPEE